MEATEGIHYVRQQLERVGATRGSGQEANPRVRVLLSESPSGVWSSCQLIFFVVGMNKILSQRQGPVGNLLSKESEYDMHCDRIQCTAIEFNASASSCNVAGGSYGDLPAKIQENLRIFSLSLSDVKTMSLAKN